jgi:hypothetical protein
MILSCLRTGGIGSAVDVDSRRPRPSMTPTTGLLAASGPTSRQALRVSSAGTMNDCGWKRNHTAGDDRCGGRRETSVTSYGRDGCTCGQVAAWRRH